MPLYDYQCDRCQAVFEIRLTFKEKEDGLVPHCPECRNRKTHQLLTMGLAVLRGHDGASQPTSTACGGCAGGSCASCGH